MPMTNAADGYNGKHLIKPVLSDEYKGFGLIRRIKLRVFMMTIWRR